MKSGTTNMPAEKLSEYCRRMLASLLCLSFLPVGSMSLAAAGGSKSETSAFVGVNDTIVFMGDSITLASATPKGFAARIADGIKTAMPGSNVKCHIAAKGGAGIKFLKSAFESKVAIHEPDIVVILIGINDVRLGQKNKGTGPEEYGAVLKELISRSRRMGAKAVVCSPLLRGEKADGSNPYDALIDRYVAVCKKVAEEESSMYIDLHALFVERLKTINKNDDEKGHLTKDGVHPNEAGNALIADAILSAWSLGQNPGGTP